MLTRDLKFPIGLTLCLLMAGAVYGGEPALPSASPLWKEMPILSLPFPELSQERKDRAKNLSQILGKELLKDFHPVEYSFFKMVQVAAGVSEEEVPAAYRNYWKNAFEQTVAQVILGRILDYEVLAKRQDEKVDPARANYVIALVLNQAVGAPVSLREQKDAFEKLRAIAEGQPVRLTIDWTECSAGLARFCNEWSSKGETWPQWEMVFESFPNDWNGFVSQIFLNLEEPTREMARKRAWASLLKKFGSKGPTLTGPIRFEEWTRIQKELEIESKGKDEKHRNVAINLAKERRTIAHQREVLYSILQEQQIYLETDTCSDPTWPCMEVSADRIARTLIPAVPFSEGKQADISWGHPNQILDIFLFDTKPFQAAFKGGF